MQTQDNAEILALSHWRFTITMIDILRALMWKIDNMQPQMGIMSGKMEILWKNPNKW